VSYDFLVNFLCRQLFSSLYFKRDYIWIITLLSLSFPPSVCSHPQSNFNSSLLSPMQRADSLLMQSLDEEALLLYQSLIIKDGTRSGYAFRGLVRAYRGMGRLSDAGSWLENYLVGNPDSSPALYASGYFFYLKEDMKRAEELFNKALELDANNALALNNLSAVLLSKKSYAQAVSLAHKAIRINPKEPMFFSNLEKIYKRMGAPDLIITDYNFYLKEGGADLIRGYGLAVARIMRQSSFRLYNEGHLDQAILKWLEIERIYKEIDHEVGLVPVYFSLGLLHEEKDDRKKAQKYFNRVLMLNPLHIQAKERLDNLR